MTKLYKLTDYLGRTRAGEDNELTWAVGVEHKTAGTGRRLCTADVIHAYEHPLIAVLMNPVHAMFNPATMRLFVAEGEVVARDAFNCGVHSLKITEEISIPTLPLEFMVLLAIWAARHTCLDDSWNQWAENWLNNQNRSEKAAAGALDVSIKSSASAYAAEAACLFGKICELPSHESEHWAVSPSFFAAQAVAESLLHSRFKAAQIAEVVEQEINALCGAGEWPC